MSLLYRNNPMVSIIVPTYNSAQFITQTLVSIHKQDFQNFEIIIVDDCSTDNTVQIVRSFNSRKMRVIVLERNHGGPSHPRNVGILASSADLIAFCDSDDLWLPHMLSTAINCLQKCSDLGLCFTNAVKFHDESRFETHPYLDTYTNFNSLPKGLICDGLFAIRPNDAYQGLFYENYIITPGQVIIPRHVFEGVGFFDENLKGTDDWDLWLRIAKTNSIGFMNGIGLQYRVREGSLSHKPGPEFAENRIKVLRKHLGSDLPAETIHYIHKLIAGNYYCAGYACQINGEISDARRYFYASMRAKPSLVSARGFAFSLLGRKGYVLLKRICRIK